MTNKLDIRPNFLVPAEHPGGALRMPVTVTLAYKTVIPVPDPKHVPAHLGVPGGVGAAICATLDAYGKHIEHLMLLVDLLLDVGGPELQAKLAGRSLVNDVEGVKTSLQIDAITSMRQVLEQLVDFETTKPELDAVPVDAEKQD